MIDGKILKFGYGDIAVNNGVALMKFIPFKPPLKIGTCCRELFANGDIERIGEPIIIKFDNFGDFAELKDKLESVRHTNATKVFEFKGYTFDFSHYDEESVDVVENVRYAVYMGYLQLAAC